MTYLEEYLAKKNLSQNLALPSARAKNKHGRWVYGSYMTHINRTPSPIGDRITDEDVRFLIVMDGFSDWNMPRDIEGIDVDPNTVCKNSFVRDMNGVLIYEGDILFYEEFGFEGVVCFGTYTPTTYQQDNTAQGFYVSWKDVKHKGISKYIRNDLCYWPSRCKVIGTIFDDQ